jgi:hypothetical protein
MELSHYKAVLEQAGVLFASGLTSSELRSIEATYQFRFPPDLRNFLRFALPVSNGFLNWRDASPAEVQRSLLWPYEGICFDIEHNGFWQDAWGPRPESLKAAFAIAKQAVAQAPTLIPILGHRYLPDRPHEADNPIFSIYQTDIIYYGRNLFDYLENEFGSYFGRPSYQLGDDIKPIEFWSDLVG